jgi:hypothetical protein
VAAQAVLRAQDRELDAELLDRCELELGEAALGAAAGGPRRLLRCVLRVPPAELPALRADRDRSLAVRSAIRDAAIRPLVAVADVSLAARVDG